MNWSLICAVDPQPLIDWLAGATFPTLAEPTKPQRIQGDDVPLVLCRPIMDEVLRHLAVAMGEPGYADDATLFIAPAKLVWHEPMLSRVMPGQSHPMHTDVQRSDCVTRVHVPLTTNDGCWMEWEDTENAYAIGPVKVVDRAHFQVGSAYTFNTLARHAFGNDGDTARVHLIFEVLRG